MFNSNSRSVEIHKKNTKYYKASNNKEINEKSLNRIKSLGIPPAYNKLWLSKNINDSIQVIALDSKNRKQYFYSQKWKDERKNEKFRRLRKFINALKVMDEQLEKDINLAGFAKKKTMAYAIKIVDDTNIRIGNKKYMDKNDSTGLTTLMKKNITFSKDKVTLDFNGKHNVRQRIVITNKYLVSFFRKMYKLPTEWLIKYQSNDGNFYRISAQDLNNYLHVILGKDFTIKDFRTHGANKVFLKNLQECGIPSGIKEQQKNVRESLLKTSQKLGNNPTTSKKSYVMEYIIDEYEKNPRYIMGKDINTLLRNLIKKHTLKNKKK